MAAPGSFHAPISIGPLVDLDVWITATSPVVGCLLCGEVVGLSCTSLGVVSPLGLQVDLLCAVVDHVVSDDLPDDFSDVFLKGQLLKKGGDLVQLHVAHVVVPTGAGDGVLWLEHESDWGVVHDDDICHGSAKPGQVLDEGIVVEGAVLPEEFVGAESFWIQLGHQWLGILGQTGSENDQFVVLAHSLEEAGYTRPNKNIDLTYLALNLNRKDDVSIFNRLELRMHKGFIQVKHECLSSNIVLALRSYQPFFFHA